MLSNLIHFGCLLFLLRPGLDVIATDERQRLLTSLLVNYNAMERPAAVGQPVNVSLNLELQHFNFRESNGGIDIFAIMDFSWHDPRLEWNPKDFGNITTLTINQRALWLPDLELYNNAPDKFLATERNGVVMVRHNGICMWADNIEIVTFCDSDLTYWPHDRHECNLRFGSWTFNGFDLDIKRSGRSKLANTNVANIEHQNSVYKLTNFTVLYIMTVYACCEEPYVSLDYRMVLERRSSFAIIFQMPAIAIVILTLLAISLEPGRGEKIVLNGTSVIIIILNLLYFAKKIGSFSRGIPLIVRYFSGSLLLVSLTHLITVFSLLATRSRYRGKLPKCLVSFLRSSLAKFIHSPYRAKTCSDQEQIDGNAQLVDGKATVPAGFHNDWLQLATLCERIAFLLIALLFGLLGASCFM